jgi:hypothetical protein
VSRRSYQQHGRRHGPGGSDPILPDFTLHRAFYIGAHVTIFDGSTANLDWGSGPMGGYGDANLLDLTDPTNPVFKQGGVYAVTVIARAQTDMAAGGGFRLAIDLLDANYGDVGGAGADVDAIASNLRPPDLRFGYLLRLRRRLTDRGLSPEQQRRRGHRLLAPRERPEDCVRTLMAGQPID